LRDKLDVHAFAVLLAERLTGKMGIEVAALHCEEPEPFPEMQQNVDARAEAWSAAAVAELAAVAEQCISHHARVRPAASQAIPRLGALV
jgi:hypothetical protein